MSEELLERAENLQNVFVVGGGAWGTALAATAHRAGRRVKMWVREPEVVAEINDHHENKTFLPGVPLSPDIRASDDMTEAEDADAVLLVVPSQFLRPVLHQLAPHLQQGVPLLICAKGVEAKTGMLMSELTIDEAPGHPVGALSGPTFAKEVAAGLPTAITLALRDAGKAATRPEYSLGARLAVALSTPAFRPYLTDDVTGAEVGGAVKNVLAIASGIANGRKLGSNARAALITRGLVEIARLGEALGARRETIMGLSGLGDLTLTCSSEQSRNMSYGTALGQGKTHDEIMEGKKAVVEGVANAASVTALARKLKVEMPICEAVQAIIGGKLSIDDAILGLLDRPIRSEAQAYEGVELPSPSANLDSKNKGAGPAGVSSEVA